MSKSFFILASFFFFIMSSKAQVLMEAYLLEDHNGLITNSFNFPNEVLEYKWKFQSNEGLKTIYLLSLYHRNKEIVSFPVRMRNLSISFYIEIRMALKKDGSIKTLSGIYDKGNKWMRVKMAPQLGCTQENVKWKRFNQIDDFQQILKHLVQQMDENLMLNCYAN